MMRVRNIVICIAGLAMLSACGRKLKGSGGETEVATGQMPAIARDAENNLHIVYGTGDSIMYTYSANAGQEFAKPALVARLTDLVDFATRGPQITTTQGGLTIIAVNKQGDIFCYTKKGQGAWVKTAQVNDVPETNKEGFLGLAGDGSNNLFAIWPDLRNDPHNKVYGARSTDGGLHWQKNIAVYVSPDSNICECCKPTIVMRGKQVYIMFRNNLKGNRDLYLIQSADAGITFGEAEKLGKGSWPLNGCPMDGGGMAVSGDGSVQTVWRRQDTIYTAAPGADEKEIGQGKGCSIETINGTNYYAWADNTGNIVCLLPDGTKKIMGKGKLPLLRSAGGDKVVCVWQDEGMIKELVMGM